MIIGCGKWAQITHLSELTKNKLVEIVACADPDLTRAELISRKFRVPKKYSDYKEMIRAENPDLSVIVVPNRSDAEVAMFSLESDSHVLVEKPITTTLVDGLRLSRAEGLWLGPER